MFVKFLFLYILTAIVVAQNKNAYIYEGRSGIVQFFEWKFSDVAKECEFLSKVGYGAVQISPVTESISDDSYSWHLRYQPVSYKIISRSGTAEDLQEMVKECQNHKIRVYVDIVANHMADAVNEVYGFNRSVAYPKDLNYPAVPYTHADFNDNCELKDFNNAFEIRNCRVDGMPDLKQANENVRDKIVGLMNELVGFGIAGFRMDSVKNMWPTDLSAIYKKLDNLNAEFDFPADSKPFIYQEVIDLGGESISKTEYTGLGLVTEYLCSKELGLVFQGKKPMHSLLKWGPEKGFVPSSDAIVFIDNHDNQRQFLKGFTEILNFKDRRRYILANAFMLATSYGIPRIMSSFEFVNPFDGPPQDDSNQITSQTINEDGQCESPWICEHRWPEIVEMIKFRNVVGNATISNWADNGQNQVAFCRGKLGFIAFNNELSLSLKSTVKTCVPSGKYCDIMTGGKKNNACIGDEISVNDDGKVDVFISWEKEVPIIAIHVDSMIEG